MGQLDEVLLDQITLYFYRPTKRKYIACLNMQRTSIAVLFLKRCKLDAYAEVGRHFKMPVTKE